MEKTNVSAFLRKYTMIIALVLVVVFFSITTEGKILFPQNINNLISQNAYVFGQAATTTFPSDPWSASRVRWVR